MNDLDFLMYYFNQYEENRQKMNEKELIELQKEIQLCYDRINLNSYNNESQIFIMDLYNTSNKSIDFDIQNIKRKVIENEFISKKHNDEKEYNIIKGEQSREVEDSILSSLPFGGSLVGKLDKAMNKF